MGLIAFIQSLSTATQTSGGGSGEILWGDQDILLGSTTVTFSD